MHARAAAARRPIHPSSSSPKPISRGRRSERNDPLEWEDAAGAGTGAEPLSEWDTSGDGTLDEGEIAAGVGTTDRWAAWDQDGSGVLEESEFNQAVFGAWDADEDGYVDESEWRANFDLW